MNDEDFKFKLDGVMHSVDKWLEGDELNACEVVRAANMREKTLQIIENLEKENVKLKKHNEMLQRSVCEACADLSLVAGRARGCFACVYNVKKTS